MPDRPGSLLDGIAVGSSEATRPPFLDLRSSRTLRPREAPGHVGPAPFLSTSRTQHTPLHIARPRAALHHTTTAAAHRLDGRRRATRMRRTPRETSRTRRIRPHATRGSTPVAPRDTRVTSPV